MMSRRRNWNQLIAAGSVVLLAGMGAGAVRAGSAAEFDGGAARESRPSVPVETSARGEDGRLARVVKTFDFDEAGGGNYEPMPRNWRQIVRMGYPRYVEAAFDPGAGHTAPPSFRLGLGIGNTGAEYVARDIEVQGESGYRIEGWIRTDGLRFASARIAGYYLDETLREIEGTRRRSAAVRTETAETWTLVRIELPPRMPGSRYVGLSCTVEQEEDRIQTGVDIRPVRRRDVIGGAWFDDISVVRIPRLALAVESPGTGCTANVFLDGEAIVCRGEVLDHDAAGLDARLEVRDGGGTVVFDERIAEPCRFAVRLGALPAGAYEARLVARCGGEELASERRGFVRVAGTAEVVKPRPGRVGVVLDASSLGAVDETCRLLELLGPRQVKAPIWRRDVSDDAIVNGDAGLRALIEPLRRRGVEWIGVLESPPASLASEGEGDAALWEVLSGAPERWRPYLALPGARLGDRIRTWQVGADGSDRPSGDGDERRYAALSEVRRELATMVGDARLAAPLSVLEASAGKAEDVDTASVWIPGGLGAARLGTQARAEGDTRRNWLVLEPLDDARYARAARVAETGRRLIEALATGAEAVFIVQPWTVEATKDEASASRVTVKEDYVIARAVQRLAGGCDRARPVWVGHGITAWLFTEREQPGAVLAAWSNGDGPVATVGAAPVGDAAERYDVWGNRSALPATCAGDAARFALEAAPTLLWPVDRRAMELQAGFGVVQGQVQPGLGPQQRRLRLENLSNEALRGRLSLRPPTGWRVWPDRALMEVAAGGVFEMEVYFSVPSNQAAGQTALEARLTLERKDRIEIELRAPLWVRTEGLDVTALPRVDGDAVEIVQRITNRTDRSLTLVGEAVSPGRARLVQRIVGLMPGSTAVRRYRIEGPAEGLVRVSVTEVDGTLAHNDLVAVGTE